MKLKLIYFFLITITILGIADNGSTSASPPQNENVKKKPSAKKSARILMPIDRADKDASFTAFREQLLDAVKRRDKKFILSVLDKEIKSSHGGNNGIIEFKQMWQLDKPNSELWSELETILSLGGSFKDYGIKTFVAPYTYSDFPEALDAFKYSVIIDKDVDVYEKPDESAMVITKLSYNIVAVDYAKSIKINKNSDRYKWVKITTPEGKKGYVDGSKIRSPIDYRALFQKVQRKWKIISLIAGD